MNSFFTIVRLRTLVSGSHFNNIKPLVSSSRFSSFSTQLGCTQNQLLQLPKSITREKMYTSTAINIPHHKIEVHSGIWIAERIVSFGLLGAFSCFTDASFEDLECLADLLVAIHVHWGLEAIFKDYLRPSVVGNVIPKFCDVYAALISVYLAAALLWISLHGNGVVRTIKQFWCLDNDIK